MMERAIARKDPMRVPDALEKIEWRLMYGEFGMPTGFYVMCWIIIALLGAIAWRLWR